MKETWHRHLGIYGVCLRERRLLVIRKVKGPYAGRLDLPGGSSESNESILETLEREFVEEAGIMIAPVRSIGTKDFVVPWVREGFAHTHCHHIAVLYEVVHISGDPSKSPGIDDSSGAEWVELDSIREDGASPLVIEAIEWIRNGSLDIRTKVYDKWVLKESEAGQWKMS